MKIDLKVTRSGKQLKADYFDTSIDMELNDLAQKAEKQFERTIRTWRDRPEFTITRIDFGYEVATSNQNYFFISAGTKVRYAHMTPDFVAKTQAGNIDAGSGAGGLAFINRDRPRPGIKARKFDKSVATEVKKLVKKQFNELFKRLAN